MFVSGTVVYFNKVAYGYVYSFHGTRRWARCLRWNGNSWRINVFFWYPTVPHKNWVKQTSCNGQDMYIFRFDSTILISCMSQTGWVLFSFIICCILVYIVPRMVSVNKLYVTFRFPNSLGLQEPAMECYCQRVTVNQLHQLGSFRVGIRITLDIEENIHLAPRYSTYRLESIIYRYLYYNTYIRVV